MTTEPHVGIHSVDFETYLGWPLVNSGLIKAGLYSARRMKWMSDGLMDMDDSRDRKFGRAFHCRLLERDTFDFRFTVQQQCAAIKGDGNRCQNPGKFVEVAEWFCGQHKGEDAKQVEECITAEDVEHMDAMIEALGDHPAIKMLRAHGGHEESAVAEINGVLCKSRFDKRIPDKPTIVDLKKTRHDKINQWQCDKSIDNYQYDIQMALYCRIAKQITGEDHRGIWVFIADKPDYDVCARMMKPEQYEFASAKIDGVLRYWQDCNEREDWPGVAPTLEYYGDFHQSVLDSTLSQGKGE